MTRIFSNFSAASVPIDRNNPPPAKVYAPAMHVTLYRSASLSLALAAMLLRAVLPDGWMPSAQVGGAFFTICSVERGHHDGKTSPTEGHVHAPCAFAAASSLAPPALAPLVFGASSLGVRVAQEVTVKPLAAAAPRCANTPRAPPLFA